MSFNPLMTLLMGGVSELTPTQSTVIELGNQTFNADNRALDLVIERSGEREDAALDQLRRLRETAPEARRDQTAAYYRALGFSKYDAIDINDLYGSLIMDLNQRVSQAYDFKQQYGLVTNNGTGEHCFNQLAILQNVHDLTANGGFMVHVMPFYGYVNHGFYNFHPNLYYALAAANGYQLITLGIATRDGDGFMAAAPDQMALPQLLRDNRQLPLKLILAGAKLPRSSLLGALVQRLKPTDDGRQLAAELKRLLRRRPNLLSFAVLRKREPGEFRMPLQTRYEGDMSTAELQKEYAAHG